MLSSSFFTGSCEFNFCSLQERAQKLNDLGISFEEMIEAFGSLQSMARLKGHILSGEGPWSEPQYPCMGIASVPGHADQVCDAINLAFVGAVGVAKWAKFQVDDAGSFFNWPVEHYEQEDTRLVHRL